ncbi:hypothetical protein Bbelb_137860 [Branchiostoma belcheri]|nr:hypothetical protein Bbelb_137860 [Branchiostoma belcheri]
MTWLPLVVWKNAFKLPGGDVQADSTLNSFLELLGRNHAPLECKLCRESEQAESKERPSLGARLFQGPRTGKLLAPGPTCPNVHHSSLELLLRPGRQTVARATTQANASAGLKPSQESGTEANK